MTKEEAEERVVLAVQKHLKVWSYMKIEEAYASPKKFSDLIKELTSLLQASRTPSSAWSSEQSSQLNGPSRPTDEEINAARIRWAESAGRILGIPEEQIQQQKLITGRVCWNDAVNWALDRVLGGDK